MEKLVDSATAELAYQLAKLDYMAYRRVFDWDFNEVYELLLFNIANTSPNKREQLARWVRKENKKHITSGSRAIKGGRLLPFTKRALTEKSPLN